MARNTGYGYRKGSVKGRTQIYNPSNGTWIKRDAKTGRFKKVKQGNPFKGVAKEMDGRRRSRRRKGW